MTDAYQCDGCGEFQTGSCALTLFRKEKKYKINGDTYIEDVTVSELCPDCRGEFSDEFTLGDDDE